MGTSRFLIGLRKFIRGNSGAVTVEWVALAGGVVVGAVVISFIVMDSLVAPAESIGAQLTIVDDGGDGGGGE